MNRCKGIIKSGAQCSRTTKNMLCKIHSNQNKETKEYKWKKHKRCKESAGEKKIRMILKENKIKFEKQKTVDCEIHLDEKTRKLYNIGNNLKWYRYDFYLPKYKTLIEFDGTQHYKFTPKFHKSKAEYISRRLIDHIKTNSIPADMSIIRINYEFINNLDEILIPLLNQIEKPCKLYSDPKIYEWLDYSVKELIERSSLDYDVFVNTVFD